MATPDLETLVIGGGNLGTQIALRLLDAKRGMRLGLIEQGGIGDGNEEFHSGTRDPSKLVLYMPELGIEGSIEQIGEDATRLYVESNLTGQELYRELVARVGKPALMRDINTIVSDEAQRPDVARLMSEISTIVYGHGVQVQWLKEERENEAVNYERIVGQPLEPISRTGLVGAFGFKNTAFDSGFRYPNTSLLNARELARQTTRHIFNNNKNYLDMQGKVESIEQLAEDRYRTHFTRPTGQEDHVDSRAVILAAGAATPQLYSPLAPHMTPMAVPIVYFKNPGKLPSDVAGWDNTENYHWVVHTPRGHILWGGNDVEVQNFDFAGTNLNEGTELAKASEANISWVKSRVPQLAGQTPLSTDYGFYTTSEERTVPMMGRLEGGRNPAHGLFVAGRDCGSGIAANAIMAYMFPALMGLRTPTPAEHKYMHEVYTLPAGLGK